MSMFTMADLRVILRQAAGEVELADDVEHTAYVDLGLDSLALLEITAKIKQSRGVEVPDAYVSATSTPAETVAAVNALLGVGV